MKYLDTWLPSSWQVGTAPTLPAVINHVEPETQVGDVRRSLVFPHAAIDRCRTHWSTREVRFTFSGLMTENRRHVLSDWSERLGGSRLPTGGTASGLWRRVTNRPVSVEQGLLPSGTSIWESRNGRKYPTKAWDDAYFKALGHACFTLCPSGDHRWTYRVFEAALCGSIPIIEDFTPAYGRLKCYSLTADPSTYVYSADLAEHNFNEVRRLITVPIEELRTALIASLSQ